MRSPQLASLGYSFGAFVDDFLGDNYPCTKTRIALSYSFGDFFGDNYPCTKMRIALSATAPSSPSDVRQSVSTLRANDRQRCVRAAVKSVGAASKETRSAKRTFAKRQVHE